MATRLEDRKHELLEQVVDRLHGRLSEPQADLAEAFLRHYYRTVSPNELLERDPLDLYGAALAHLRFGEHREAGQRQDPRLQPTDRAARLAVDPYAWSRWSTTTCRSWSIRSAWR